MAFIKPLIITLTLALYFEKSNLEEVFTGSPHLKSSFNQMPGRPFTPATCFGGLWSMRVSRHQIETFIENNTCALWATTNHNNCDSLLVDSVKARRMWVAKQELLLERNIISKVQLSTAQLLAYSIGHFEVLNQLLGSKIEEQPILFGPNRLMKASCAGRANTVAALLRKGVKLGDRSQRFTSELLCAMSSNYSATAYALLKLGNVSLEYANRKDATGQSAFFRTLRNSRRFFRSFNSLLQLGVDVNQRLPTGDTPLTLAVKSKASNTVIAPLLDRGALINAQDSPFRDTALHCACRFNVTDAVDLLLQRGASVLAPNRDGVFPFAYAVQYNLPLKNLDSLLLHGAFIDARDYNNATALHFAVRSPDSAHLVPFLLSKGANVNAATNARLTPLHLAASNNLTEACRLLLEHGANVNASEFRNLTVLIYATTKGNIEIVRLLLHYGADVNAQSSSGITALHSSAAGGFFEINKLLLDHGADVNMTSADNGATVLIYAAYSNDSQSVKLFLQLGVDVNAADKEGRTALVYAAGSNASLEIIKMLLASGANVNSCVGKRNGPVATAIAVNNAEALELLIRSGADLKSAIEDSSILSFAIRSAPYSAKIVKILLDNGAQVNQVDQVGGASPLHTAARLNSLPSIRLLLEYGADVNQSEDMRRTALHMSILNRVASLEVVRLLVGRGADVNAIDAFGQTPYLQALGLNFTDVAEFLLLHGGSIRVSNLSSFYADLNPAVLNNLIEYAKAIVRTRIFFTPPPNYPFTVLNPAKLVLSRTKIIVLFAMFPGFYDDSELANSRQCPDAIAKSYLNAFQFTATTLSGYTVILHYYDAQGPSAMFAPQLLDNFVAYQKEFPTRMGYTPGIISPIFIGPGINCSNTNPYYQSQLRALRIAQRMNRLSNVFIERCPQIQIEYDAVPQFQSGVAAESSANETEAVMLMAVIHFAKALNWKQLQLICLIDSNNLFVLSEMPRFHRRMIENGLDVSEFYIGESVAEIFNAIKKQPRARILFVANYRLQCSQCIDLFCSSYHSGVGPDKYAVLMIQSDCLKCYQEMTTQSSDPALNCSLSVQQNQMKMFFFGTALRYVADKPPQFGGKVETFSLAFQKSADDGVNGNCSAIGWNALKYSFLSALYLLHTTVEKLKTRYQLSLFDVITEKRNLSLVDKTIAETAAEADLSNANGDYWYVASRTGVVVHANVDATKMAAGSVKSYFEWRIVAKVWPKAGKFPDGRYASYGLEWNQPVIWATKNGQPPQDLSRISLRQGSHDDTSFVVVVMVASILSAFQIALTIKSARRTSKEKANVYFDIKTNPLLAVGCLSVNISATILLAGMNFFPLEFCYFRPFFIISSVTFINGGLFAKMWFMAKIAHENRYISRKYRKPNLFNEEFHEQERKRKIADLQNQIMKTVVIIFTASIFLQAVWFCSDSMVLRSSIEYDNDPLFDADLDSYYVVEIEWCESKTQTYWIAFFVTGQALLLGISGVMALTLKQKIKFVRKRFLPDIFQLRMAVNNSVTILVFTSFLMVVIPSKPFTTFYLKTLVFAVCELVLSATTFGILFFPVWAPLFKFSKYFWKLCNTITRIRQLLIRT